jgi:riboflavin synthase
VVDLRDAVAAFDAVPETLARTTLGSLSVGDRVNLERSLPVSGRLDGHFVQGHVDGTARLVERRDQGSERLWRFQAAPALTDQMVPKGSIAIDGVSLTLVEVAGDRFTVALIPTTLAATTLGDLAVGHAANIETDILGKYVLKAKRGGSPGLTLDKLRDTGFLD